MPSLHFLPGARSPRSLTQNAVRIGRILQTRSNRWFFISTSPLLIFRCPPGVRSIPQAYGMVRAWTEACSVTFSETPMQLTVENLAWHLCSCRLEGTDGQSKQRQILPFVAYYHRLFLPAPSSGSPEKATTASPIQAYKHLLSGVWTRRRLLFWSRLVSVIPDVSTKRSTRSSVDLILTPR